MFTRFDEIPTMAPQDIKETKRYGWTRVPFRITKGNNSDIIGLRPILFSIKSISLVDMNIFARFDDIPTITLQDIKETKRYGQTDTRTDNVKTVYHTPLPPTHTQAQFAWYKDSGYDTL